MPTATAKRKVEVFRAGTFTTNAGRKITFTADQVAAIARNYDAATAPAPVVIGHPGDDAPAFGWATAFEFTAADTKLHAELDQLAPEFVAAVQAGQYKRISIALFDPDHSANPKPGEYYPRHIGFLGGAAPAVPGLRPVHFAAESATDVVLEFDTGDEFADPQESGKLRALARAVADALGGMFDLKPRTLFAARNPSEDPMNDADKKKLEDLTAENARLKADGETRAKAARAADATAFCDGLVKAKKLAPKDSPALVAAFAAIPADEIEFTADGKTSKESPLAVIRRVLEARSPLLKEGEQAAATREPVTPTRSSAFSTAEGFAVDPTQGTIHAAAKNYQREHKCTFADAVDAVQRAAAS